MCVSVHLLISISVTQVLASVIQTKPPILYEEDEYDTQICLNLAYSTEIKIFSLENLYVFSPIICKIVMIKNPVSDLHNFKTILSFSI